MPYPQSISFSWFTNSIPTLAYTMSSCSASRELHAAGVCPFQSLRPGAQLRVTRLKSVAMRQRGVCSHLNVLEIWNSNKVILHSAALILPHFAVSCDEHFLYPFIWGTPRLFVVAFALTALRLLPVNFICTTTCNIDLISAMESIDLKELELLR